MIKNKFNAMKLIIYISYFMVLFPILILGIWCLTEMWTWPNILPQSLSLRGFSEILSSYSGTIPVLISSMIISWLVAIITVLVSIPAARAMVLEEFKGKGLIKFIILMPVIVPTTAFAMGIHIIFIKLGVSDSLVGVILVHIIVCLPYVVRILMGVIEVARDKLEIQARVLGASPFNVFKSITLPLLMPGIISAMSMAYIISFTQYFLTFLIGGGNVVTYSVKMFPYIQSGDRTIAASYSIVFIIATLTMFVIFQFIVKKYYKVEEISFLG